jgi:hypothetical protein
MFGQFGNVGVSVDGGVVNSVTDFITKSVVQSGPDWYWYLTTVLASVMLPTLSEGNHNVTVYYGWQYLGIPENPSLERYEVFAYATVSFVVGNVDTTAPSISIQSPCNNSTYNAPDIELTFLVNETVAWMGYSLDGGDNVTVSNNITLAGLFDGIHCITIFVTDAAGNTGASETIYFTVDDTAPVVSVTAPENKTYYTIDIALNFTVNEPVSLMRYGLDGETAVEISGNTTLAGLSYGAHNLTVYAVDVAGNVGASETISFSVEVPFPTTLVALASVATVAVVGVGLLLYFKKRKR